MRVNHQTFRAGPAFPVKRDERWTVRDGAGRIVENWRVKWVTEGKADTVFAVEIDELIPA